MLNSNADIELLLALNSFFVVNDQEGKFIAGIAGNPLFRGFPILFSLVALWFSVDCNKRRSRMLLGILAACLATLLSVWLQHHFALHVRPFLDPALHLRIVEPERLLGWYRRGSFPSDTATLYFSLVTIIFLENRLAGYICFIWALVTVGIARVALGFHYPSDVVGSLVLGPVFVYLFESIPHLRALFERVLKLLEPRVYIAHAFLFLFLAEAYNLLLGLQGVLAGLLEISSLLKSILG